MARRRLVVMADYSAFPVWDRTEQPLGDVSGDLFISPVSDPDIRIPVTAQEANGLLGGGMVGEDQLPISRSLKTQLWGWAAIYECLEPESGTWTHECSMEDWLEWGRELATALQLELGPGYEIRFHDERTGEEHPV